MIICLDIGNTHIYGGVLENDEIKLRFRYPSSSPLTSDVLGIFLKDVLEKNNVAIGHIEAICLSSVVPALDYSVIAACKKYFGLVPFDLKPHVKTNIKLDIDYPSELGADRLANAIAATHYYPNKPIMITDFGTATTVCAISKDSAFLGGAILPGLKLSMEALSKNAAKLADIELVVPETALGKNTETNLQSGLVYGQLGAIKEIIHRIKASTFANEEPVLLSTGGYAHLFEQENFFTAHIPDLVLHGLRLAWEGSR
jgi:type III pantothenate kinase